MFRGTEDFFRAGVRSIREVTEKSSIFRMGKWKDKKKMNMNLTLRYVIEHYMNWGVKCINWCASVREQVEKQQRRERKVQLLG